MANKKQNHHPKHHLTIPAALTSTKTQVKLTPQGAAAPQYFAVIGNLIGDSQLSQVSGSGGWQIVDRPKNVAATQWYDRSPFQIQMTLLFDNSNLPHGKTASDMYQQLISWVDPIPNTYQPPVFTISGPVPGTSTSTKRRFWYLYSFQLEAAVRDGQTGKIVQQGVQITCYEFNSPIPGVASFAEIASQKTKIASKPYLVGPNQTIQTIARGPKGYKSSQKYHTLSSWVAATNALNNLRDPKDSTKLKPGTTIKIPR